MKTGKTLFFAASLAAAANTHAATITWDGGGDGINWSDGANWGGTAPGSNDTARFNDVTSGTLNTTVDAATTIQFLNFQQSTTTATNAISLGANLTLTSNNGTGSGITYASTISNAAMINWDINGNYLRFSSNTGDSKVNNLYGTFTLDTTGSRIGTPRFPGTATGDTDTFNFGNSSNVAIVNVTANAQIGRINTGSSTNNGLRLTTINIGSLSEVNLSNEATLEFLQRARVDADNTNTLAVNNSGTVNIAVSTILKTTFAQVNSSNRSVNISFNNQATGVINHNGTVAMSLTERGIARLRNSGTWNVGTASLITGTVTSAGSGDGGTVAMTNQSGGIITGSVAAATLDYNPLTSATYLNQKLTLTNQGILSPGVGHNGDDLDSVGTLSLTDIDATFSGSSATLRLDLGGTGTGEFDKLALTNGTLTLDSNSKLELFYVNHFADTVAEGNFWEILSYGAAVTTGFDLASALTITGASGFAANPSNYSITFGATSATLSLVPEPTGALAGLLIAGGLLSRRRRAC